MMALTMAATSFALATLVAMYADAKFLIRHDLASRAADNVAATTAMKLVEQRIQQGRILMYHSFERWATNPETADNIFLIFEDQTFTYKQFFGRIGQVGNWLIQTYDIQKQEIVALDGINTPEYILLWLGLEAIGACPAFINSNLTAQPLAHCVALSKSRYLLADSHIRHLVEPCTDNLKLLGCEIVYYDPKLLSSFDAYASRVPSSRLTGNLPTDISCLLYTSGTTSLPKAFVMLRSRELVIAQIIMACFGLSQRSKQQPDSGPDRMYTCLPMYHITAHSAGCLSAIEAGTTLVLSRKFSNKTFWPEVHASRANVIHYIGELSRYLISAPPRSDGLDREHNVHVAFGSGLRADVWERFRTRFNIPVIIESYAASDGIHNTLNRNEGPFGSGAIAKRGLIWHWYNSKNQKIVRIDPDTEEIVRDPRTGFATECRYDEAGQAVSRLLDPGRKNIIFRGYHDNPSATSNRWAPDLFEKGDQWFKSGDLHRQNADGTVEFVDRLGDTFRWKGENVSTMEVADVFGRHEQVKEVAVIGVQVPRADGRCGLAAVVLEESFSEESVDWKGLAAHAAKNLPGYAVPIFVRVVKSLDVTGTWKIQKGKLKTDGVDIDHDDQGAGLRDSLYWLAPGGKAYVPFRRKEWDELNGGRVRL